MGTAICFSCAFPLAIESQTDLACRALTSWYHWGYGTKVCGLWRICVYRRGSEIPIFCAHRACGNWTSFCDPDGHLSHGTENDQHDGSRGTGELGRR